MFVPLDPFAFTATDEVSFRFFIKSAPSTNVFLMEMDDFEIGSVLANDVSLIDLQKMPFSQVKRTQLGALQFKGSVFNEGTTDLLPVYVKAEISPLNLTAGDTISSLQSGTARSFTTEPSLTIGEAGTMTVSLSASPDGVTDPNPSNNLSEFTLEVTDSTMAKDMGDHFEDVYMNYGTGSGGKRIMANAIRTTLKDTLTSVSVYIGPITADCQVKAFFANRNAAGNWVEDSSATIVTITTDMADSWVPLRFRKPTPAALQKGKPVVANTENLYGLKIRSGNPLVGFNFENATDDGSFIWLGGQWLGTQDITIGGLSGPYSLFIRANFGRPVMSSTTPMERSLEYADLVPNPASNGTNLVIGMQKESSVRISVHTLTGQVLSSQDRFAFKGINRLDVPVNGLAKGIYLVKIDANGFSTTKKLIIE